ncbi:60s acidic ribosomal protein-domain-containing protein [Dichotomocladium elegans]|nr:60s acidic ribosomal protein-domain-containing protein [Dichotomocladium elegans]
MSAELAIVYAALILKDDNVEISADKLQSLTKAAGFTEIEPIWYSLYAKALEGQDIKELVFNVGAPSAAGGVAAAGGAATGAAAEAAVEEEKKEEEKEESDDDMGFGLFD